MWIVIGVIIFIIFMIWYFYPIIEPISQVIDVAKHITTDKNIKARGYKNIEELKKAYQKMIIPDKIELSECVKNFSQDCFITQSVLQEKIAKCLELADKMCVNIKGFNDIPWNIIFVSNEFESGLPCTIDDAIIIPIHFTERPCDTLIPTLIHEKTHLYQKQYPKLCKKLYELWNFQENNKLHIDSDIKDRQRENPDITNIYTWKNKYIFKLLKTDDILKAQLVQIENNQLTEFVDPNFKEYFKGIEQLEHPDEIMAEMMEKYLTGNITLDTNHSDGARQFKKWLEQYKVEI